MHLDNTLDNRLLVKATANTESTRDHNGSNVSTPGRLPVSGAAQALPEATDLRALQLSEERWRNLVEGSLQGILIHRGARLLFANQTLVDMLGYANREELLACPRSIDLVVPKDRGRIKDYLLNCTRETTPSARIRVEALRKDGSTILAENAARIIDWEGEPALQSAILDISKQDRIETALRKSEARYRELAEAGSDWYWETDAEHRFVHISRRLKSIIGPDPEKILGKTRFELAGCDDNPKLWRRHKEDLDARRPFRNLLYPMGSRYTQGNIRYVKINGTPRFNQSGEFIGYRGTATDVTAEEKLLQQARSTEQRFIDALKSSTDSLALYDANECLVVGNAAWRDYQAREFFSIPEPGDSYADIVREHIKCGTLLEAAGKEEHWLHERLASFRKGSGSFEIHRADGRWLRVHEQRTPDGSTIVTTSDISEFKEREAELRLSEQRFRDFAAATSDWYWETDAELHTIYLSDRYTEITGRPREQRLGRKTLTERPHGISDAVWQRHQEDLAAHKPFRNIDYEYKADNGRIKYFRINGLPVFNDAGEFQGYRGTGLDNSKETLIRQTEERFRDVIETISDGYALFDAQDRLQIYNNNWLEIVAAEVRPFIKAGIGFEEIIQLNLKQGHWPHARDHEQSWVEKRLRQHRQSSEPFEIMTHDNHWYLVRERRTRNQGILLTTSDITEHKLREQALEQSELRFRDFAETAADWFWELDPTQHFKFVSERFHEITGIPVEQILGSKFSDLLSRESKASLNVKKALLAFSEHRPVNDFEFQCPGQNRDPSVHTISGLPLFDSQGGFLGYRGTGRDITQARELSVRLAYQASHDELTGLTNRREFEQRLTRTLESSRHSQVVHALCYLDLDQFKVVNDTCGHAAGDALLRQLGTLLKERIRSRDTLARLGGDEFALLLEYCTIDQASQIAKNLLLAIENHEFNWDNQRFRIGVSIGLVPIDNLGVTSATEILRAADSACYMAKDLGRNRVHVYTLSDSDLVQRESEMQWVSRINKALADNQFVLYGQAIHALNRVAGEEQAPHYEILLRMRSGTGYNISPGTFLPAAERYGLANRIDRWVVAQVFEWISAHPGTLAEHCHFNINLSAQSLGDETFEDFMIDLFQTHHLPAENFCFEITETAAIANFGTARQFMHSLREQGCRFALDDFGSGLSSYATLRDLPVDFLKIDGSFIRNILADPVHLAMVRSINDIGHVMGKQTVAEYVQDRETLEQLTTLGVDFAQGFGIGRPTLLDTLLI